MKMMEAISTKKEQRQSADDKLLFHVPYQQPDGLFVCGYLDVENTLTFPMFWCSIYMFTLD